MKRINNLAVKLLVGISLITPTLAVNNQLARVPTHAVIQQPVVIGFYDEVNKETVRMFADAIQDAMKANNKNLVIRINSPGGSVASLGNIVELLRMYKQFGGHITTVNVGMVASAAVDIYLLGDHKQATAGSVFVTHYGSIIPDHIDLTIPGVQAFEKDVLFIRRVTLERMIGVTHTNANFVTKYLLLEKDTQLSAMQFQLIGFEALKIGGISFVDEIIV